MRRIGSDRSVGTPSQMFEAGMTAAAHGDCVVVACVVQRLEGTLDTGKRVMNSQVYHKSRTIS